MFLCAFIHSCIGTLHDRDSWLKKTLPTARRIGGTLEKTKSPTAYISESMELEVRQKYDVIIFRDVPRRLQPLAKFRTGHRSESEGDK